MIKLQLDDLTKIPPLERALVLASFKHSGQVDKGGHAYIHHPLRVMSKMTTEEEKIVAILHDVIEDTDVTKIFYL